MLIVEDDPDTLACLEWLFTDGFDLHVASNGVEAIEVLGSRVVDVVVLDLTMAPLDGYDVVKFVRDQEIGCRILLASAQARLEQIARQVGADAYVTKPYDLESLKSKVERLARLNEPS
ncbi:MAG: response regulator with CheY-like receiver domain and winged-helix DNA-binding domain [Polyangiaceae bacterium]|nr:response regulator with CheY-like receiver domain and winged-helix DNA-binding domain [Polyangiaceae bacterium]